jgi:hypothetical protein
LTLRSQKRRRKPAAPTISRKKAFVQTSKLNIQREGNPALSHGKPGHKCFSLIVEFIQCSFNPRTSAEEKKRFFRHLQTQSKEYDNTSNADFEISRKSMNSSSLPRIKQIS